jgi:hypothetical protein
MRYSGEARFNFSGDKQKAMLLIPQARTLLGILLNDAQFNSLEQARRQYTLKDGIVIEVVKLFNMNQINIHVPVQSLPIVTSNEGKEYAYYFTLFKVDHPIATDNGTAMGYNFDYLGEIQRYYDEETNSVPFRDPYRGFILPNTKIIVASREAPPLDDSNVLQCFKLNYKQSSKIFLGPGAARPTYTTVADVSLLFSYYLFMDIPIITMGPSNVLTPLDNTKPSIESVLSKDIDETQDYWTREHIPGVSEIMGNRKIVSWCDLRSLDNNASMDLEQTKNWIENYNSISEYLGGRTVDSVVEIKKYSQSFTQGYMIKSSYPFYIPREAESVESNTLNPNPAAWTYHHAINGVGGTFDYFIGSYNQYEAMVNQLLANGGLANTNLDAMGLPARVYIPGEPIVIDLDVWVLP